MPTKKTTSVKTVNGKSKSSSQTKSKTTKVNDPSKIISSEYSSNNNYKRPAVTELDKINADPALLQKKIKRLLQAGRAEIETREQLENFPLGSLVAYVTKEGLYRSGGFLRTIQDEYFALQGGQINNPISFPVQFKNVKAMYVGNSAVIHFPDPVETTKKETKYPSYVGDIVVNYARDKWNRERFEKTKKFQYWIEEYNKGNVAKADKPKKKKKKAIDI